MFGGKRRVQQHAIAQLRVEVAAERHARDAQLAVLQAALVGAVARASDAEQCALHRLRVSAEQNTAEVAALLAQLAQTYAALIDSLEIARADRAALAETVQQLVEATYTLATRSSASRLGFAHDGVLDVPTDEERDAARGIGTEVWCRFQNRWIGGFEIADTADNRRELHYRIRRTSDGYVLPTLFAPADIRAAKPVR